ncbi:MAG TPA: NmrA/HSCARG family protein [Actinomycetota bacterium]|nr:NmrA/HSCARG family protein [Actinomycetota bacterium]
MANPGTRVIAVVGATGLQGGAVTTRLLDEGWSVRALTRDPAHKKARPLTELGAHLVKADTTDPSSLDRAFDGVHGVFNVQNHHISGYRGEVTEGKNVAEAAKRAAVPHVVYGSAGPGTRTGVGSWDTKVEVAEHMRAIDLPVTILRPMAFMELMTAKKFYPTASTWHVMPKLMGWARPVGWLAVDDLGAIAARAFAEPGRFIGRDIPLTSDVQSIDESRAIWRQVTGKLPRSFPMPVWLFRMFVGTDEITMWRWLRVNEIDLDASPAREVHPNAMTVGEWVARRSGDGPSATGR